MPYLGVLGSNFEKLLSYLKSEPSNLLHDKVWNKTQNSQIWDKMLDLGVLGLEY